MTVLETLAGHGAVLTDKHFVYKSGKHGPHYINMDPVFPDTNLMYNICLKLAEPFLDHARSAPSSFTIAAAATGGIPLAVLTAQAWGNDDGFGIWPSAVWADKVGDDFAFERSGFVEQLRDRDVLVVEDLLNTGDTTKKLIAQVRANGGNVIGVSVICNRGGETAESLDVPRLEQLSRVDFQAFAADTCPLCVDRVSIVVDIGHGAEFQAEQPDYPGGFLTLLS